MVSFFGRAWPWKFFITRTDAMRPGIFAGDVLVVRRTSGDGSEYDVGDVIAYQPSRDESLHIRRICMKMHPSNGVTEYLVRRDADRVADERAVQATRVIGEVEARLANIGRVVDGNASRSPHSLSRFATAPNARRDNATLGATRDVAIRNAAPSDAATRATASAPESAAE